MEAKQDLEQFLADLETHKVQDKLLYAEQTFHSYDKKIILMMDEEQQTHQMAKQEHSLDPHYSVLASVACIHKDSCLPTVNPLTVVKVIGSASQGGDTFSRYSGSSLAKLMLKSSLRTVGFFSFDNATNSDFKKDFVRAFKSDGLNVVLEIIKQNEVIYQTLDHTDSLAETTAQKRPVDHSTHYDGQHILIMEDDPVVREAVTMLYEKHPTVSSVYVLENETPKLIKGEPWPLTDESRLVLVGHGRRGPDGRMRLSSYSAEDVAQIISHTNRDGDQIKTISVVACDVGSDKVFIDALLQELRAQSVEAELHLRSALLQVSHSGEKITVEITPSGLEYRHKDPSKKVVAVLGRDGETVTRVDLKSRGEKVSFREHNFMLGPNYWEAYKNMWPEEPRRFVEQHARQLHTDDLEGLAWAFFHDAETVQLIARGVNKLSEKYGQVVNTTDSLLRTVTNIQGSPYNDALIGNELNNLIDGGGGTDYVEGGNGEDIYVIKRQTSLNVSVTIDNHATDSKVDLLLVEAKLHNFKARVQGNDLILMPFANARSVVTLHNWFLSENHRHLLAVTEDFISFTVADNPTACQQVAHGRFQSSCLISQSIDYSDAKAGQQVDLEKDKALHSVTEVRGSNFNDDIRGNAKHNMIVPGGGNDFMQGRGGEDWYIVSPGHGTKTINNYSPDMATDMLLLKERYSNINAQCDGMDAVLYINNAKEVILQGWFQSKQWQHLQIQSDDGYVFKLESNVSNCVSPRKYPVSVDFRKRSTGVCMEMDNNEFSSVVEMYGSSGVDEMIGNDQDNMLDPYTGGARMEGGEGKDTYIVKPGYGTNLTINNYAEDESVDVVMFDASFQVDNFTVKSEHQNVLVSAREGAEKMQVLLARYGAGKRWQHLHFQTADGVHFLVKVPKGDESLPAPEPRIEAFKIVLNDCQRESHTDLNGVSLFSQIGVVQGCPYFSNHIQGNSLENALFGGVENDAIDGGTGDDTLVGGKGDDILLGEAGDDTIYGEEGDDYMLGGAGHDAFIPGPGKDTVDGGPGRDTVLYQGDHEKGQGVYVNLLTGEGQQADADGDILKDVENVIGTIYPDILVSGYEPALLKGSDGNDILVSLAGGDYLIGGDGNDMYILASYSGSLVIDNCAKDNATDVLYLDHFSDISVNCSYLNGSLSLSISGPNNSLVEVELRGWTADKPDCRHLLVVLSNSSLVSLEELVKQCKSRHINDPDGYCGNAGARENSGCATAEEHCQQQRESRLRIANEGFKRLAREWRLTLEVAPLIWCAAV
ncbi:hypothetical protein SKAU_G00041550 [Synaphobranchus kaupii]|uniref:Peptidase C80 domain-containing protein n=1 Tax=Synaphobranchus kaupii TaxID=118154 RepID=A0A9Q1J8U9_SYNKA|nr:hypothetical protein SKAU_G00041550 [Synaphobranchus kaupii]